jgi:hypothetical protein
MIKTWQFCSTWKYDNLICLNDNIVFNRLPSCWVSSWGRGVTHVDTWKTDNWSTKLIDVRKFRILRRKSRQTSGRRNLVSHLRRESGIALQIHCTASWLKTKIWRQKKRAKSEHEVHSMFKQVKMTNEIL